MAPSTAQSVNPAFRYLGIPQAWLQSGWKPRLPSHKTSGFLFMSTSVLTLYLYDRLQCRKLRESYIREVEHLSQDLLPSNLLGPSWLPRRVTVYGARVPEDVDIDRGVQWFKKYVKPILIAAAVDYRVENGTSPGALGRKIASDIQDERIIRAAQEKDGFEQPSIAPGMPGFQTWHFQQNRLAGANLILGRASLKEYLWGLKRGYRQPLVLDGLEDDERLAQYLNRQGLFDEPEAFADPDQSSPQGLRGVAEQLRMNDGSTTDNGPSLESCDPGKKQDVQILASTSWFPSFATFTKPSITNSAAIPPVALTPATLPPSAIPVQPPLLLVPFDHPIGIIWWPLKLYRFFNRREDVKKGAEAAKSLILGNTQPIELPSNPSGLNDYCGWLENEHNEEDALAADFSVKFTGSAHLDFLCPEAEHHLRRSYKQAVKTINEERSLFRSQLKERLLEARKLEHRVDDSTSTPAEEMKEVQLRQEALGKEKKWRNDIEGWRIVRAGSGVCWDPDMEQSLRVFASTSKEY